MITTKLNHLTCLLYTSRNTTQNCGKYDVRITHDNYNNDNYNCKYENYRGYRKRRMKKPSTAVYMGLKQTEHTQCIHDERIMECDRYERKRGKMKTLLNEQVTYTIKTNVHKVSTHTNEGIIQWNADVVYMRVRIIVNAATTLQRNNIRPVDYGQYNCYKEGCQF